MANGTGAANRLLDRNYAYWQRDGWHLTSAFHPNRAVPTPIGVDASGLSAVDPTADIARKGLLQHSDNMTGMPIAEFRRIADADMQARGFRKLKMPGYGASPSYAIGDGEVVRHFFPQAIRRPWGCVMQGTFFVSVPPLERWLLLRGERADYGRLGYYITNEPQFFSPAAVVSEADLPALWKWFDAIHIRVLSLPATIAEIKALTSETSPHLVLLRESIPEFWRSLKEWDADEVSPVPNGS